MWYLPINQQDKILKINKAKQSLNIMQYIITFWVTSNEFDSIEAVRMIT
jgi:hypothetical protein